MSTATVPNAWTDALQCSRTSCLYNSFGSTADSATISGISTVSGTYQTNDNPGPYAGSNGNVGIGPNAPARPLCIQSITGRPP